MSDFDTEFIGAPDKLAQAMTFRLISSEKYQRFVTSIRDREGIVTPETLDDLPYNLEHHPPENFEAEACDFALRYFTEDLEQRCPDLSDLLSQPSPPLPSIPQDIMPSIIEGFHAALDFDNLAIAVGQALSRHIVTGFLEVPAPIPMTFGGVSVSDTEGEPIVMAVASAATDLDALLKEFRDTCKDTFDLPDRRRGPDLATQTGWLDACDRILRLSDHTTHNIPMQLAEISYELGFRPRPDFDTVSPDYEATLRTDADAIRKNLDNYQAWLDRTMPDENTPENNPER